jgi:nucleotide-binding universal stress UspA family protein
MMTPTGEQAARAVDTIVVPLDGSDFAERALRPAGALAAKTGAEIVVMTSTFDSELDDPKAYLADTGGQAGIRGARAVVSHDPAPQALVRIVAGADHPVVCMTTHGRSGVLQVLLGSVAEEVTRVVSAPLLLVGPEVDPDVANGFDSALVCTDGSEVSQAIVPVLVEWVPALHMRVWVVQVLDSSTRRVLDESGEILAEENDVFAMAQTLMNRDGAGANWEVLHGDRIASTIVDYAAHLPASIIAMATHGRTGLGRVALGSVAAAVVHEAPCPVLVTRPGSLLSG